MRKRLRKKLDNLNFSKGFSYSKIVIEAQLKEQERRKKYMQQLLEPLYNEFIKNEGIDIPTDHKCEWINDNQKK